MQSVSASIFNVSARKCRSPNAGLPLRCYCWPACPEAKFLCKTGAVFPSRVCWGPRFIFRGCWMSLVSEGAIALSSGSSSTPQQLEVVSTVPRAFLPPPPHPAPNPFSFSFSLKKHDCVIDLSYIFTTMQPPPHSSFRTVPAPWGFSSHSLYSIPVPSSL